VQYFSASRNLASRHHAISLLKKVMRDRLIELPWNVLSHLKVGEETLSILKRFSVRICLGFALLQSAIETNPKPIMNCAQAFSRAWVH